jgi:hypothetical protein
MWQGPEVRWGDGEYLMAMAVDLLAQLNHSYAMVHAEKGHKPKAPARVPRPTDVNGVEKPKIVGGSMSLEELDRVIEAQTGAPHGIAKEG